MQNYKVIDYGSSQLKNHEHNYPTHNKKLTIIVFALKIWCYYHYGESFEICADHKSIKYLFSQKKLKKINGFVKSF